MTRAAARPLLGALAVLLATAGCGIRATDVPVDAGPAPTRATCGTLTAGRSAGPAGPGSGSAEVYLVCGSRVEAVARPVDLPEGTRNPAAIAAALLAELKAPPADAEEAAGFSTEVPADLEVSGPADGDPEQALRLSSRPGDLSESALVQIICTFAHSERLNGNGRTVVLGGPADSPRGQPRMYACTMAMRTSPESAEPPGPP